MVKQENEIKTIKTIEETKVINIKEICQLLLCSTRTAQRHLKQWQAYNSCNHNGRFYTLPNIAKFDRSGLWRHKGKLFSRHGNLKETVLHFVKASQMGLDASEIGKLLQMLPHSFMSHFRNISGIRREKYEGRFVYFSDEETTYRIQRQKREDTVKATLSKLPLADDAIIILVDCIKHPDSSAEECALRIRKKAKHISVAAIRALFDYHGIEKKTADTPS